MHIQVLKENLLKALTIASRYSAQKAQLPVLGHLLIEATKTGIYVSATDLDMGIRLRFAGKVIEPGEVVVPARILAEYIGVLPLGVIEVKSEKEEQIVVAAKQSRATFQILSRADFPDLPRVTDEDKLGEMVTKDWLAIWQAVEYSISKDLARPVLTGILWELNRGKLVATDGYRLTIIENNKMQFGGQQEKIIVNGAFWGVIAKTLDELQITGGAIYLLRKEKQLMIEAPDITLVGRLIEGDYPNYQAILPQKGETAIVTEREALLSAVRGAMIFARDSAQIVKLKFISI